MSNLNQVNLIGHLGGEVIMHHFQDGGCVGRVSLATNETYTKKDSGEKVTTTQWHNLVFRNKPAEVVEKWTTKGDKLRISGKLVYNEYEKDGNNVRVANIEVKEFEF